MITRLIEIMEDLRKVIKQQGLNISDETLFDNSCQFLRGEFASNRYIQPSKGAIATSNKTPIQGGDSNNLPIENKAPSPTPKGIYNMSKKPATLAQLAFAQKLADQKGVDLVLNNEMTSYEVSKLIETLKKSK